MLGFLGFRALSERTRHGVGAGNDRAAGHRAHGLDGRAPDRVRNGRVLATVLRPVAATITILSQKGGTGKTTTVRTLTDAYRRVGLDVLCVDLDPQGNLSD